MMSDLRLETADEVRAVLFALDYASKTEGRTPYQQLYFRIDDLEADADREEPIAVELDEREREAVANAIDSYVDSGAPTDDESTILGAVSERV